MKLASASGAILMNALGQRLLCTCCGAGTHVRCCACQHIEGDPDVGYYPVPSDGVEGWTWTVGRIIMGQMPNGTCARCVRQGVDYTPPGGAAIVTIPGPAQVTSYAPPQSCCKCGKVGGTLPGVSFRCDYTERITGVFGGNFNIPVGRKCCCSRFNPGTGLWLDCTTSVTYNYTSGSGLVTRTGSTTASGDVTKDFTVVESTTDAGTGVVTTVNLTYRALWACGGSLRLLNLNNPPGSQVVLDTSSLASGDTGSGGGISWTWGCGGGTYTTSDTTITWTVNCTQTKPCAECSDEDGDILP